MAKKKRTTRARTKPKAKAGGGRVRLVVASIDPEAVRLLRNAAAYTGAPQGEILERAIQAEVRRMARREGVEAFPEARGPLTRGVRPKGG